MALVWVATAPIHFNNVLAFNPGDVVPDSIVARFTLDTDGLVEQAEGSAASGPHYGVNPVTQTEFNALVSGTGRLSDASLRAASVAAVQEAIDDGVIDVGTGGTPISITDNGTYATLTVG